MPPDPLGELQAAGAFGPNLFYVGLYAPPLFFASYPSTLIIIMMLKANKVICERTLIVHS